MAGTLGVRPRLSIGISTLDRHPQLEETLAALHCADLRDADELLIVDQSEKAFRIEPWRERLPVSVRVIHQQARGLAVSRNELIREARADVLLFLDDDVVPDPGLVAAHAQSYVSEPGILGVAGLERLPAGRGSGRLHAIARRLMVEALRPYWRRSSRYRQFLDPTGYPVAIVTAGGLFLCDFARTLPCRVMTPRGCNMSFRIEALRAVAGFDLAFSGPRRDESDLSFRLRKAFPERPIVFNPKASLLHRMAATGGVRAASVAAGWRCEIEFARRHLAPAGYLRFAVRHVLRHAGASLRSPARLVDLWRNRPH